MSELRKQILEYLKEVAKLHEDASITSVLSCFEECEICGSHQWIEITYKQPSAAKKKAATYHTTKIERSLEDVLGISY